MRSLRSAHRTGIFRGVSDILQDLRTVHVSYLSLTSPTADNVFDYPSDYESYTQISVNHVQCEIFSADDASYSYVINSDLASPSPTFPTALLGFNTIELLPDGLTTLQMSYFKTPQGSDASGNKSTQPPTWAHTTPAGTNVEIFNVANSINFELPVNVENRLTIRILEYFGVNLREEEIESYAKEKQQMQDIKETE